MKLAIKMTILIVLAMNFPHVNSTENPVVKPITAMFDAMRENKGDKLVAQFTSSAILQRVGKSGEVKSNDIAKFAAFVSKTTKQLDEKLLQVKIQQSDNLASVWTPYVFYLDGKLSHCGVNSFQLVDTLTGWKIAYLVDNTHAGDCKEFIKKHL